MRSTGQEMAVPGARGSPASRFAFPLLVTFHCDGTAAAAAPDASSMAQLGVWVRTGYRQFQLILMFFTFDATARTSTAAWRDGPALASCSDRQLSSLRSSPGFSESPEN